MKIHISRITICAFLIGALFVLSGCWNCCKNSCKKDCHDGQCSISQRDDRNSYHENDTDETNEMEEENIINEEEEDEK